MEKQKVEWSVSDIVGNEKCYILEGTELDKELYQAFCDMDKEKCLKLIEKGANKDAWLIIENGNGEKIKEGPLFQHLVSEEPAKAKTAQLNNQIEDLRQKSKNQHYPSYMEEEIKQLQQSKNQEIASTKNHNEKREAEILDFAEFWLDIGGGRPLANLVSPYEKVINLDKIKFPKVREFVDRACTVDSALYKKANEESLWHEKGIDDKLTLLATFYRQSDLKNDEIAGAVDKDSNLNNQNQER